MKIYSSELLAAFFYVFFKEMLKTCKVALSVTLNCISSDNMLTLLCRDLVTNVAERQSGAPTVNFRKISVWKSIEI